jgi:hypothetical protein
VPTPRQFEYRHEVPHPRAPIDSRKEPFVGNRTADDNLAEAVVVAIWTVAGVAGRHLVVDVEDGIVRLAGVLESGVDCKAIESAVAAVNGVREVVNRVAAPAPAVPAPEVQDAQVWRAKGSPLLAVTRFCGTDEASLSAAIRDGVQRLDATLSAQKVDLPTTLFVVYRNQQRDTVTVEVGMPVGPTVKAGGEFRRTMSPVGTTLSMPVAAGAEALVECCGTLGDNARRAGFEPKRSRWQQFDAQSFRPWVGHPAHTLNVSVSRRT